MRISRAVLGLFLGLLVLAVSACGGESGSGRDAGSTGGGGGAPGLADAGWDLGRFFGIWSPISGTTTTTCGADSNVDVVTGNVTWVMGTSSDLVQTLSGSSCVLHANVTGSTASGVGPQVCTVTGTDAQSGDPITETATITAYTFVVSPDGLTATENLSGSATVTDNAQGLSVTCSFSETGASYQKQ